VGSILRGVYSGVFQLTEEMKFVFPCILFVCFGKSDTNIWPVACEVFGFVIDSGLASLLQENAGVLAALPYQG
jgi:hypothetical protein